MEDIFSVKILRVALTALTVVILLFFLYLLSCVRPQSDDLGFLNLLEHFGGSWNTYRSFRQTLDAGIYTLLFTLPIFSISRHISTIWLMLCLYGLFFLSLYHVAGYLSRIKGIKLSILERGILCALTLLFFVFTSWNRGTFQNATFWFTGIVVYIFPMCLIIWATIATLRREGLYTFPLFFIIGNTRVNYIMLSGIILALLFFFEYRKKEVSKRFWFLTAAGFIGGFLYYLLAPGNYVRLNKTGIGSSVRDPGFYSNLLLDSFENLSVFFTEPYYMVLFTFIFLVLFAIYPQIRRLFLFSSKDTVHIFLGLLTTLWLHGFMIVFLLNGRLGYGRIYAFAHLLFIIGYLIILSKLMTFIPPLHTVNWKGKLLGLGVSIIILAGVFYQQIRMDLFRAKRFALEYDQRYEFVNRMRLDHSIQCIIFNRFSNAGILGIQDLQPEFDCLYPRTDTWIYGQIRPYDNWVFEQYYDLSFKIVTVERSEKLPLREGTLFYDVRME